MKLENLSIVTCCTPNYAKYLGEWARSIVGMGTYPAAVCLVANGKDARTERAVAEAATVIRAAGIEVRTRTLPACNVGESRNAAVALSDTEWVMHFDCDDLVMPHMLAEVSKYMADADVIPMGYERSGDLAAGPVNRQKLYKSSRGKSTLESIAPASGVSPFRRSFWERSPYRTDMEGGWDTALWLGFAHLNARFIPTQRHCFYYRQHADSTFNTRRKDARITAKVSARLASLRRGDMGVSLIVPLRDGNAAPRNASWSWLRRRYEAFLPELEIVTGTHSGRPWCKGAAINEAVKRSSGEVLIIADADCWVDPAILRQAVELVRSGAAPWIVPHGQVRRMDQPSTEKVIASSPGSVGPLLDSAKLIRVPYTGYAGGGIVVVTRPAFDYAGGFPSAFRGWGCEDEALALAFDTLLGKNKRLGADLWHFWHAPGNRINDPGYRENRKLLNVFKQASGKEETMYRLVTNGPEPEPRRNRPQRVGRSNIRVRAA